MKLRSLLISLGLLVGATNSGFAGELTRQEIVSELIGRQIAWWEEAGWRHGYLLLMPDGVAEMTVDRPMPQHDLGQWSMRGSEVCTRWDAVRGGAEKCYRVSRSDDGLFVTTGGNVFEVRELGV